MEVWYNYCMMSKQHKAHALHQRLHAKKRAEERSPHNYKYYIQKLSNGNWVYARRQSHTKTWFGFQNDDGTISYGLWSKARKVFITFYTESMYRRARGCN
jgi:hypothetical protein